MGPEPNMNGTRLVG
jgi:hypothetical protein